MSKASSTALRFSKMHGAGNDFVVIDLRDGTAPPTPELPRALPTATPASAATRS